MIDQMDKASTKSSWDRAKRLFDRAVELEKKRQKSSQARVPSDPNAWYQIRETYEAIVLEDYDFSEKHDIEYALWLLHYKRIEEFRAHFSAIQASARSNASNGARSNAQPDRLMKMRVQFKAFLSETTGFYHDLILKIRSKYGLPLGQFSENDNNHASEGKDEAKSAEVRKGLMSCHRCLIYLGDLARYKGQYGEGESRHRDFAAASSYYLQAASLCPSSGNPHHQLAILASYSGDELVSVYRHFRSLAAEISFPTAKDNLVIVFEKNRQSYSQLLAKLKAQQAKESEEQITSKGSGSEVAKSGSSAPDGEGTVSIKSKYKELCIRFVRLNGILFTRTSLETFTEVLSSVKKLLQELLSSGSQEKENFGSVASESGLTIMRVIAVLIFTVNNVNKKTEGQTYAECLQHTVLVENAATATFELVSLMMQRCTQLQDPSSSYLIPGILIFLEWLACCPDVASCTDTEKKPSASKSLFWKHCIMFLNKLVSDGGPLIDDGDDACFTNMSKYEEGGNESQYALPEDFELRGFLPLIPAQSILDFSRNPFAVFNGSTKEKKIRVRRILSAGKALSSMAMIDQKPVYFDSRSKQFIIGFEPQSPIDHPAPTHYSEIPKSIAPASILSNQPAPELFAEGDDEDEEIVFKPTDRQPDAVVSKQIPNEGHGPIQTALNSSGHSIQATSSTRSNFDVLSGMSSTHQQHQVIDSFSNLGIVENGHPLMPDARGSGFGFSSAASQMPPIPKSFSITSNGIGMFPGYMRGLEPSMPLQASSFPYHEVSAERLASNTVSMVSAPSKAPINRPVRHLGPPPGFKSVPSRPMSTPISGFDPMTGKILPPSTSSAFGKYASANVSHDQYHQFISNPNNLPGMTNFPFPGKQPSAMPMPMLGGTPRGYQNYQTVNQNRELNMPELEHILRNQQFDPVQGQHQGQYTWNG